MFKRKHRANFYESLTEHKYRFGTSVEMFVSDKRRSDRGLKTICNISEEPQQINVTKTNPRPNEHAADGDRPAQNSFAMFIQVF